jgi:lipopolysaccharide heptosyltransferase I
MEVISLNKAPGKILIIKPSSLGDVVHCLPFLYVLHECFPDAAIHWIVARGNEGVLEGNPRISKLWIIDKDSWKDFGRLSNTLSEIKGIAAALRKEKFDMVIDLQGLMRSGLMAMATGAPVRIGFSEAREGSHLFYTHKVRGGKGIHAVDRYLKVARALGCQVEEISFPLPLTGESEKISRIRNELGDYAVIVPGARWHTKQWPAEKFAALASEFGLRSLIVGSAADRGPASIIGEASGGKAVSLAGETDIRELIDVIRGARYVITNDSGPMHIAAACGIPVIAIFGPTNPALTGPYGSNHIIVQSPVDCSPCRKRKCDDMKCMKGISVGQVMEAIVKISRSIVK